MEPLHRCRLPFAVESFSFWDPSSLLHVLRQRRDLASYFSVLLQQRPHYSAFVGLLNVDLQVLCPTAHQCLREPSRWTLTRGVWRPVACSPQSARSEIRSAAKVGVLTREKLHSVKVWYEPVCWKSEGFDHTDLDHRTDHQVSSVV